MKVLLMLSFLILSITFTVGIKSQTMPQGTTFNSLRVLDINVWSGLDYKGYIKMGEYESSAVREKRYLALVDQITRLNPDIIGIHEANKLPHYAERLANDVGLAMFYHIGVGGVRLGPIGLPWNLREGDAILVKKYLNPQLVGRRQLSGGYVGNWAAFHFSDATQVIAVKFTYQDKPIFIFATHWHASLSDAPYILERAKEMYDRGEMTAEEYQSVLSKIKEGVAWRLSESKKTVDFIKQSANDHLFILMGDFNTEQSSQEIRNLLQFGMVDIFQISNPDSSGFTWDPRTNLNYKAQYLKELHSKRDLDAYAKLAKFSREIPKRIDYIFLGPASLLESKNLSIRSSKVVMTETMHGVHASDHYGIFAEISLNE